MKLECRLREIARELFGPLSELHVHGGGWKLLDASKMSGPRDSHSFCFDASRSAVRNCASGCAKVESPQCPFCFKSSRRLLYRGGGILIGNYICGNCCVDRYFYIFCGEMFLVCFFCLFVCNQRTLLSNVIRFLYVPLIFRTIDANKVGARNVKR